MSRIGWMSLLSWVALACGGGTLNGASSTTDSGSGGAASQGGPSGTGGNTVTPPRSGSGGSSASAGGNGGRSGSTAMGQGGRSGSTAMSQGGSSGQGQSGSGSGGTGGRPSGCPSTGCPNGMLPTDVSIFGPLVDGAFYLFREPHITVSGNPPVVTAAVNLANPGTRDLTFPNPPRWLPNGGADGRGAAQFDGVDDYGVATGFSFPRGSNPSIVTVLQLDNVSDRISVGVQLNDGSSQPMYFLHAAHIRTMSGDLYRANAHPIGVPHNIDYLTPESSNDTAPHVHETHMYASGMVAGYDGRMFGGGGGEGTNGEMNTLRVGSNALGTSDGSEHAAMQISELVIAEGATPEQARAYRMERIRTEYPSISVQ